MFSFRLCNSARKLFTSGQKSFEERDEEMAYIYFMKYLNIIELIRKSPQFANNKEFVNKFIGRANVLQALKNAEIVTNSLNKR